MTDTPNFGLTLLATHQAQKHVTVNEALVRLDVLARPRVERSDLTEPPSAPLEGQSWLVASGATGAWAGHSNALAFFVNGGWGFHNFELGARVWDDQASEERVFDGIDWVLGGLEVGTNGATTRSRVLTFQHSVGVGGTSTSAEVIPSHAIVHGVTARVVQEVVGSGLTGFSIGVSGSTNRYGAGIGLQQNAWAKGVTGQPVTYYSDEPIVFTAEGGTFTGGEIDVAVHLTELSIPRAI